MPRTSKKKPEYQVTPANGGVMALVKELWQAAVNLRGSVEPVDYKRYVLPIIFLRFLSLRFEARRAELDRLIKEPQSEYFGDTSALNDPDEYKSAGAPSAKQTSNRSSATSSCRRKPSTPTGRWGSMSRWRDERMPDSADHVDQLTCDHLAYFGECAPKPTVIDLDTVKAV